MEKDLDNRPLAVVTGASSGIGRELAKQFAQNGFDLLVVSEDPGIVQAAREFEALGAHVDHVQIDLATYDGVEQLYTRMTTMKQPVEAIAINAGVGVGGDFTRQTDLAEELKLIDLNVKSTVHLAKRIAKDMVTRKAGRILFTSSVASSMPGPYEAVYAASKAFIQSFSEALRYELKDTGVTVTALLPGPTDTNFFHRAHMDDTKVGAGEKDDPALVAKHGFDALMAGKDQVVAGSWSNKAQVIATGFLPETLTAGLHADLAKPGSAND